MKKKKDSKNKLCFVEWKFCALLFVFYLYIEKKILFAIIIILSYIKTKRNRIVPFCLEVVEFDKNVPFGLQNCTFYREYFSVIPRLINVYVTQSIQQGIFM